MEKKKSEVAISADVNKVVEQCEGPSKPSKAYVMPGPLVDQLSPEANKKVHQLIARFVIKYHDRFLETNF